MVVPTVSRSFRSATEGID